MTQVTEVDRTDVMEGAVGHMLALADAAAAREDYDEALACLRRVAASGHRLDHAYESRCEGWRLKAENVRVGCSEWFG